MPDISMYPITRRWPASNPDVLQLYSLPTPNGVKISIALEEIGLPYEPHFVSFEDGDQHTPEFLSLNPNNKIPAILDPNGPDNRPLALWESGAILLYLADKTGQLLPENGVQRYLAIQWLMFQMGGVGPMFGQLGFFHKFAGKTWDDKRPLNRYVEESERLLEVMEGQLQGRDWLAGEYSIADISVGGWVRNLVGYYDAADLVDWDEFPNMQAYLDRYLDRPAVQRGLKIPAPN